MNNRLFSILMLMILLTSSHWAYSQSTVKFRIKNAGFTVNGSFEDFKSIIKYVPENPKEGRFIGTIQVASINTNNNARDKHLRNEDFFHVDQWPEIKFRSTSIQSAGNNRLKVTGKLTIKEVTKTVTLDIEVSKKGTKTVFESTLQIDRLDYGVGTSSWTLANKLYIDLHIEN